MNKPLASWQVPVRCRRCDDVIWSRKHGEFVACKCGAIFCDQTPHYARYGGNPADFDFGDQKSPLHDGDEK